MKCKGCSNEYLVDCPVVEGIERTHPSLRNMDGEKLDLCAVCSRWTMVYKSNGWGMVYAEASELCLTKPLCNNCPSYARCLTLTVRL